ncbi:MAG: hypothetical protein JO345_15420 [Streptosporangiaceae bacterium]|nr:hypothetical protein [Streptosporangiaceae bacterium]
MAVRSILSTTSSFEYQALDTSGEKVIHHSLEAGLSRSFVPTTSKIDASTQPGGTQLCDDLASAHVAFGLKVDSRLRSLPQRTEQRASSG